MRTIYLFCIAFLAVFFAFGCSSGNQLTSPTQEEISPYSEPMILGAFNLSWDGVSDMLEVAPDRQLEAHHNITPLIVPKNISFQVLSWNPTTRVMTVKVTIKNPTSLDVYDVRGILTNLGAKKLLNADDYTKLFDKNVPPVANPFRAFAKDEVNRKFWGKYADPSQYIKSEIYEIYFPSDFNISYLITAAWPSNAPEPYDIFNIAQVGALYKSSGSLEIFCEVADWQDITADHVVLEGNPVTGGNVNFVREDTILWNATITNSGNAPVGDYEAWIAAYDVKFAYPLYNKTTIHVYPDATGWSDPILVAGTGSNEILPRIVLRKDDYWIIYSDGTSALSKYSTDDGLNWSAVPQTIGGYANIDTLHAVEGLDTCIYVQYQNSDSKYITLSKYDGSAWAAPVSTSYHGMTLPPYSCDLGLDVDGYIYDMLGDDWSALGFRSAAPYDISVWNSDPIESFYNAIYSVNDGFVQNVDMPKFFFVHEGTELDYAWYNGAWQKAAARTGTDTLIEPAIAPESDAPYHGLVTVYDGVDYELEYFRYDTWPPVSEFTYLISEDLSGPGFSSISIKGDMISILFDVNGEIHYVESPDGGITFSAEEVLGGGAGGGTCAYSHVRIDRFSGKVVAAYSEEESGSYNIYIRMKR